MRGITASAATGVVGARCVPRLMMHFRRFCCVLALLCLGLGLRPLLAQPSARTLAPSGRYQVRLNAQGDAASLLRVECRDGRSVWQKRCVAPSNVFVFWAPKEDALFVYEILDGRGRGVDDRISIWRPAGGRVFPRSGMAADGVFEVAWSPDGQRLLVRLAPSFGSLDLNRGALYWVDLAGGKARLVATSVRKAQWRSSDRICVWEVEDAPDAGAEREIVTKREIRVRP